MSIRQGRLTDKRTCANCSPWRGPTPTGRSSPTCCGASTTKPVTPAHQRCTASRPPSRPGGRPSKPRSPPATPTPDQRATTAWLSTKAATRSASGTLTTNAAGYGGPAPANTGEPQPQSPRCPANFEEPVSRAAEIDQRRQDSVCPGWPAIDQRRQDGVCPNHFASARS